MNKFNGKKYLDCGNFKLNIDCGRFSIDSTEILIIKNTIKQCLKYLNIFNTEIGFSFVDPSIMRSINLEYRNIDKETDVLSFPIDDDLLGDIVMSRKRCYIQSRLYGNSYYRELSYLICHSILHLVGYDHMNIKDKKIMRYHEKEIMKRL